MNNRKSRVIRSLMAIVALFLINVAYGESGSDIISEVKRQYAPDSRTAVWTVSSRLLADSTTYEISGKVDKADAYSALMDRLAKADVPFINGVQLLPGKEVEKPWALVAISVASIRSEPRSGAELSSQAIMGTPVRVLEHCSGGMSRVQTPDNYIGYVTDSSLEFLTAAEFDSWRSEERYVVTAYQSTLFGKPNGDEASVVSDLVLGVILRSDGEKGKYVHLILPDGRDGYARKADVARFDKWAEQKFDVSLIEKNARRMMGSPYLWGGMSTKMADCSGFVKTAYFSNGIILQRDASQQALTGLRLDWKNWNSLAEKGDLIFVGSKSGRVTHVMMYIGDGKYIHSSGRVKINSLNPQDADYLDYNILSMSRIKGQVGTAGIVAVNRHPWYFLQN